MSELKDDVRGELQQQAVVGAVDDAESVTQCQFVGRLTVDAVHDVTWSYSEHFCFTTRLHLQRVIVTCQLAELR